MREKRNAIIEATSLGLESHGIFSAYLTLSYGGSGQAFGGYGLDRHNGLRGANSGRVGTAYGMEFIARIMQTVGVDRWEDLKGKHLRADMEHGKVHGIGHILEEKWFYPADDKKLSALKDL